MDVDLSSRALFSALNRKYVDGPLVLKHIDLKVNDKLIDLKVINKHNYTVNSCKFEVLLTRGFILNYQ